MGSIQKDWPWRTIAPLEATCFIWIATPKAFSVQQPADVMCESAHELVNNLLLHCTFTRQIWTMFRAIFGVQQVMSGCIKLALSSWNEQLHKGTMNTMQLLFLPSFSGLFGWRGIVDISMTREARKKGALSSLITLWNCFIWFLYLPKDDSTSLGLTCNSCYENRVRSMGFRTELTTSTEDFFR
ncbi:hypothetical protein H5410_030110 [Solanum commersonii]|uniref:Uncharacterized protein n=1 Tax=Solanum commersonii TaxID=4109 RepID=A0A9J5YHN9_SOLCO|nr:hypothetical protein H5410_030110 [Solanum commersonii]